MTSPEPSIVLIGPPGAGKSTVGQFLARRIAWSIIDLDDFRDAWSKEFEASRAATNDQPEESNGHAVWQEFEINSVERVLREYGHGHVLCFGGGHAHFERPEHIRRLQSALRPHSTIVLLTLGNDVDAASRLMKSRRMSDDDFPDWIDLDEYVLDMRHLIESDVMQSVCTMRIDTSNMDAKTVAQKIEKQLTKNRHRAL